MVFKSIVKIIFKYQTVVKALFFASKSSEMHVLITLVISMEYIHLIKKYF
jgi:hypothetical protein